MQILNFFHKMKKKRFSIISLAGLLATFLIGSFLMLSLYQKNKELNFLREYIATKTYFSLLGNETISEDDCSFPKQDNCNRLVFAVEKKYCQEMNMLFEEEQKKRIQGGVSVPSEEFDQFKGYLVVPQLLIDSSDETCYASFYIGK